MKHILTDLLTAAVIVCVTSKVCWEVHGYFEWFAMAFVVAGISVIHQMEQIPKGMAALIQMSVIYIDYLAIYLINGWMPLNAVGFFTVGFLACFAIIWGIIYLTVRKSVKKLNSQIGK
mgnify:CR=1 FL=1